MQVQSHGLARLELSAKTGQISPMRPKSRHTVRHDLPDVRDGLTQLERAILVELHEARAEFGERHVPTALLYGRVVEHVNVSVKEFQRVLTRTTGGKGDGT
jgi:hypothetical protein